jgi:glutamate synthase domain-containing protein 1
MSSAVLGADLQKLYPISFADQSDTATFDNCLELLTMAGYPLSQAVMKVLADPVVTAKVASLGGEVGHMNAQEFKQFIDVDYKVSRQIVQSTGMKPE